MSSITFTLTGEFVPLCDLLKLTGLADSGGAGKALVAARAGQVVAMEGARILVQG